MRCGCYPSATTVTVYTDSKSLLRKLQAGNSTPDGPTYNITSLAVHKLRNEKGGRGGVTHSVIGHMGVRKRSMGEGG